MSSPGNARISSGIAGLDELLAGGLLPQRSYLVRGPPGLGKTTLGLHFLTATTDAKTLFIGFQEPEQQLRENAASVGIDVSGTNFLSLLPDEQFFTEQQSYDVFSAADVEQEPMVNMVIEAVERLAPSRVFVDSLTQLRFLSADVYQYRKQALSFLRFLTDRGATVIFSSESNDHLPDDDLQFLADGIMNLERAVTSFTVEVRKYRGSASVPGRHQFRLGEDGLKVYPHPRPPVAQVADAAPGLLSSGNEHLDSILHGGLEAGTVTLVTGPTGIGKSTLATNFAVEAAHQGRHVAIYMFEEELNNLLWRSQTLKMNVDEPFKDGRLMIDQIEPLRYLSDEFMSLVRDQAERYGTELVILDSVTGMDLTMESVEGIGKPLHALSKTLCRNGVSVILVNENAVDTDELRVSERDISHLADNVIYLRYIQPDKTLQKVIGVLKKRLSGFENGVQRFEIGLGGVRLDGVSDKVEDSIAVRSR